MGGPHSIHGALQTFRPAEISGSRHRLAGQSSSPGPQFERGPRALVFRTTHPRDGCGATDIRRCRFSAGGRPTPCRPACALDPSGFQPRRQTAPPARHSVASSGQAASRLGSPAQCRCPPRAARCLSPWVEATQGLYRRIFRRREGWRGDRLVKEAVGASL